MVRPGFRHGPRRSRGVGGLPVLLAASTVLLLAIPGTLASAAPGPSVQGPAGVAWAYGAERTFDASGTAADGNTTFTLHAAFGWNTVLSETNGTNGTLSLVVNRTAGASLFASYCRPGCGRIDRTLNVTERVWETQLVYANLTAHGVVSTATGPASALAIVDTHVVAKGSLVQTANARINLLRGSATASSSLDLVASSDVSVLFQPPLGLLPTEANVTHWHAASNFTADGSWDVERSYHATSFLGSSTSATSSFPGSFTNRTGTVGVSGSANGSERLDNGLASTRADLALTGPFTVWEGFILMPTASDLLAPASAPWQGNGSASELAQTSAVDLGSFRSLGHLPVVASATTYAAGSTDAGSPSLEDGTMTTALQGVPAFGPSPYAPDGPGAATVQAQPESPSAASASSSCLISVCASGAGHVLPRAVLLGLGVVVVAAIVAVAVVASRQPPRRVPPTATSTLYPPVGSLTTARPRPARAGGPAAPETGDGPDPLDHLW